MRPRIVALIVGCLILLPGVSLLFAGGALGIGYLAGRNDAGYFQATLPDLHSPTAAITGETPTLTTDIRDQNRLLDVLDTDVRLEVSGPDSDAQTFIGIGPTASVDAYLGGVARDEIVGFADRAPVFHTSVGTVTAAESPTEQDFWVARASGSGPQQLDWQATPGQWTAVIMNTNGAPDIDVTATVAIRAGFLLPLTLTLLVLGFLITAAAVALIVVGVERTTPPQYGGAPRSDKVVQAGAGTATSEHPVVLTARLDPGLSRWQWLVKWFLAIPHYVVLAFLWVAFLVVTIIAGFCILFTGRYPRPLFDFTSGVLRWTWRVSYYAASGGLGTDQYPPFTLGPAHGYPASLDIVYPATLSRGLVLVKWWLLAIPHYLIIGLFVTNWWSPNDAGDRFVFGPIGSSGLFGLLVLVTAFVLLFTGTYPPQLFALIIGGNRWIYRVIAYATLMTDKYPPFQLDQGGSEPSSPLPTSPGGPATEPIAGPAQTQTAR
jgi:hypothetical protein